jgi:hypothetical protein
MIAARSPSSQTSQVRFDSALVEIEATTRLTEAPSDSGSLYFIAQSQSGYFALRRTSPPSSRAKLYSHGGYRSGLVLPEPRSRALPREQDLVTGGLVLADTILRRRA